MMKLKWIRALITLTLFASLLPQVIAQDAQTPQELCDTAEPTALRMMQFEQAEQVIDAASDYRAIICTSAGAIYVDLYEQLTPITVNNFVFLAGQGYYDGTSFHRVIPQFMAQGGDPTGTGRGGPGYQFEDEPIGFLTFDRPGLLAMANAGPGTNGSQFFLTTVPTPHLNYKHTIFGEVLAGQEIVEAIRERDPSSATEMGETLHNLLIITDADLVESDEPQIVPATEADVAAAFESFSAGLPPTLPLDDERSGYFSTEDLASTVAEELQTDFASFAEAHSHQYRHRMQISNAECDTAIFFSALGYWVDVFADAESASAAAQDDFMQRWLASYDYQQDVDSTNVYLRDADTCAGETGAHVLGLATRGRFLVTIDALVAEAVLQQVPAEALLDNLSLQIEGGLASIFRSELR